MTKCIHDWKLVTESYEDSPMAKAVKLGMTTTKIHNMDFCYGTKLVILKCVKCGQLDKTVQKM